MTKKIPLSVDVTPTFTNVDVTAAPGSAGTAFAYSAASSEVVLTNLSVGGGLQYKVDAGAWMDLARHEGVHLAINLAASVVSLRRTQLSGGPVVAHFAIDGVPSITVGAVGVITDGANSLVSGAWSKVPSIFRLRLTGTGTCVVDSRNRLGTVSTAFASYSPNGATNQIEYPYPGDDAVEIRATLTGTCKAEVI